jgi:hypothetical protein
VSQSSAQPAKQVISLIRLFVNEAPHLLHFAFGRIPTKFPHDLEEVAEQWQIDRLSAITLTVYQHGCGDQPHGAYNRNRW